MTMSNKIKIDIVSDVVCPWCIVGYKRLEQAMRELGVEDKFEIEWHPFELNPNMPPEGKERRQYSADKYGMSMQDVLASQANITKLGGEVGFTFDFFEGMHVVNTKNAHVLLEFAKKFGKQTALKLALFKAFFTDNKDISKLTILEEIVQSVGLNVNEATATLNNPKNKEILQEKESYWQNKGVSSVPTMVFNSKTAMNGAYPVETYKQVITELLAKKI